MGGRLEISLGAALGTLALFASPVWAAAPLHPSPPTASVAAPVPVTAPATVPAPVTPIATAPPPKAASAPTPAASVRPSRKGPFAWLFSHPSRRSLLDINGDGKVTSADLLALAGVRDHVDRICALTPDNRLTFTNPYRLSGDVLLDLAEHGKVDLKDPMHLMGLDALDRNTRRLSLGSHGLTYEARWLF